MKVFFRNRSEFRSRMAEMHSQALQRSNRDEDTNDSIVADLGDTFQVVATRPDVIGSAHCKCDVCEVCRNRKRKRGSSPTEKCDTAQDRTSNISLANPRRLTEHAAEEGADDPAADDPAAKMGVVERIMGWLPLPASAEVKNGIQDELEGVHEETLLAAMRWIAQEPAANFNPKNEPPQVDRA
jgi:hypothetical protein